MLERLYGDRTASVRRRALRVLLAQNGVTVERLQPCLNDIDPEVRTTAAERVGAWPVLLELARTGSRSWRVRSASTLARVGAASDPADRALVRDVLVRALDDAELACAAVEGLAALGGPDVLPPLTEAARNGPVAARAVARRAVDRLQWQFADTAGGLLLHQDTVDAVGAVALADPAPGEPEAVAGGPRPRVSG